MNLDTWLIYSKMTYFRKVTGYLLIISSLFKLFCKALTISKMNQILYTIHTYIYIYEEKLNIVLLFIWSSKYKYLDISVSVYQILELSEKKGWKLNLFTLPLKKQNFIFKNKLIFKKMLFFGILVLT